MTERQKSKITKWIFNVVVLTIGISLLIHNGISWPAAIGIWILFGSHNFEYHCGERPFQKYLDQLYGKEEK